MGDTPAERDPDRGETPLQKQDRNWTDLLQELRVLQTGIQILTGFLLTLPFQQRFTELNPVQVGIYLCLVVLSVLVTALLLSTAVLHRAFFQRRIKGNLVDSADLLLRLTLVLVGLILVGTIGLVFDLVLSGSAGAIAAASVAVVVALLWLLLPLLLRRQALRRRTARQHRPRRERTRRTKGGRR
ncbi:DUF6328 family protein [Arthrobacter sp. zg-Y844]|uniref:DUF6328 family protein n=1 Tax=Arthrobacter sp. zg-Y844 TaxID=2964612 RepID=UPI0021041F7C|nr:DUF6328 family protein [Arthrobacter sp. zg-Y844]MCQ1985378.1 DUF6328 family protein [Arthrobacter sp. zg-Y844]